MVDENVKNSLHTVLCNPEYSVIFSGHSSLVGSRRDVSTEDEKPICITQSLENDGQEYPGKTLSLSSIQMYLITCAMQARFTFDRQERFYI